MSILFSVVFASGEWNITEANHRYYHTRKVYIMIAFGQVYTPIKHLP